MRIYSTSFLIIAGFCVVGCGGSGATPNANGGGSLKLPATSQSAVVAYDVTDLGTLGGTFGFAAGVNSHGLVTGTSTLPGDANFHAFVWSAGNMTDVGTLGGPNSRTGYPPNERGEVAVDSETAIRNPLGADLCTPIGAPASLECFGTLWRDGVTTIEPTLGGYGSGDQWVDNTGRSVGGSETTTPDPACSDGTLGYQRFRYKPVIYEGGGLHVLPTIGDDPDGVAFAINDAGLVAVSTGRCNEPGLNHMYVWDHGVIRRISDFGGTGNDVPQAINALGQVIGCAALAGQNVLVHPFLWSRGVTTDLGTLPGDVSSCAYGINERTQIVGESDDASGFPHPYLWQNGKMVDLNEFVSQTSPLLLLVATWINDKGWITGLGLQPTGAIHPFLAIPTVGTSSVQGALRTQEMQSRYKGTSLASFVPLRLRAMFSGARGVSSMKPTR